MSANASVETPWRADDDDETLLTSFSTELWQTFVIKKKFFMPHSPQQQQHHPTRDNTTKLSHERVSQRASVEHGNMFCILGNDNREQPDLTQLRTELGSSDNAATNAEHHCENWGGKQRSRNTRSIKRSFYTFDGGDFSLLWRESESNFDRLSHGISLWQWRV